MADKDSYIKIDEISSESIEGQKDINIKKQKEEEVDCNCDTLCCFSLVLFLNSLSNR